MRFYLTLSFLILLFSCSDNNQKMILNQNVGYVQGTTFNIKYLSSSLQDYKNEFDSIFSEIDLSLSLYIDSSIITRFNKGDTLISLDSNFLSVFNAFKKVANSTNGNFDCTISPLINAWGFGVTKKEKIDSFIISDLLKKTGYQKIYLKNDSTLYNPSNVQLNFDALAQGFTVDVIANFLENNNINNYLIEIGGELRAKGENINNKNWRIGIDKPINIIDDKNRFQTVIELKNKSVATSGNYRNFYIENGKKYSHSINPFNGYPVKHNLLSVTVITDECIYADAYATAFMVMGVKKTKDFLLKNEDLDAFLIYQKNNILESWSTNGFKKIELN